MGKRKLSSLAMQNIAGMGWRSGKCWGPETPEGEQRRREPEPATAALGTG